MQIESAPVRAAREAERLERARKLKRRGFGCLALLALGPAFLVWAAGYAQGYLDAWSGRPSTFQHKESKQ